MEKIKTSFSALPRRGADGHGTPSESGAIKQLISKIEYLRKVRGANNKKNAYEI